jgi:hypothetical protein
MRKASGKALFVAGLAAAGWLESGTLSHAGSRENIAVGYGGHHHPYDRGRKEGHGNKGHDRGHDKRNYDKGHDRHGHDRDRDYHGRDYHDRGHRNHGHKDYGRDYGHRHGPGCGHYSRPYAYHHERHYYPRYAPPPYYPPYYYRPYTYHHPVGYYCGHCHYRAATVDVFHHHIVHEHRTLVWTEVLASLTWVPQTRLYVFGEFDF